MRVLAPVFLIMAVLLGGCAGIQQNEAAQQEKWLLKAGFRVVRADTPEKLAMLSKMTPYKIESKAQGDTMLYRYVNPAKGCVYIGGPREYAAYKEISVSAKSRRAANMAQMTSSNWRVMVPMVW